MSREVVAGGTLGAVADDAWNFRDFGNQRYEFGFLVFFQNAVKIFLRIYKMNKIYWIQYHSAVTKQLFFHIQYTKLRVYKDTRNSIESKGKLYIQCEIQLKNLIKI